jgi:CubicO group peptidase (beta-lactamase class C family)
MAGAGSSNTLRAGEAAGAIYSNITDMSKWVQTPLARGKYGDGLSKTLISESVHRDPGRRKQFCQWEPRPYNTISRHTASVLAK